MSSLSQFFRTMAIAQGGIVAGRGYEFGFDPFRVGFVGYRNPGLRKKACATLGFGI